MFKFELGDELKELVTGFTGVVMSRTQYFTGCNHYGLQSIALGTDGKPIDWQYFDESRLVTTGKSIRGIVTPRVSGTSGPHPNAPQIG